MNILVSGSTGFIGKHLCKALFLKGHKILVLSRNRAKAKQAFPFPVKAYEWDPLIGMPPREAIEAADAIIHLLGENVGGHRWNEEQKKKIRDSRVISTKNMVTSILRFNPNLKYFLSASAVGYYGDRKEESLDESSSKGEGFLSDVCKDWEDASALLPNNIQRTIFRISLVLGKNELLDKLARVFKLGLGASLGNGQQWMSWISIEDLVRAFIFALENKNISGVVNLSAPPIRNKDFTIAMAKHFHRPYLPFSPKKMVTLALGEFSSVLFASQKVISKKLNENNFNFQFTDIKSVLVNHYPSGSESYLYSDQFIEKPITDVFNFFSDEKNLEAITPPWLNFKVLNKSTKTMQEGTLINYELKIRGVLVKWQTKILEWKPTSHFIDTQLKGPYKIWHHTHEFIEVQGGTFMTDIVKYEIPYGIFGSLAKLLFVKNDVEKIFNYRFLKIKELFSTLS
jgi:uncharacterized protein (TIGR01777 family)